MRKTPRGYGVEFLTNNNGDRMVRIGGQGIRKKESLQGGPIWQKPDSSPPGLAIFPNAEIRWAILECDSGHLHRVEVLATAEDLNVQFNTGLAKADLASILQARQAGTAVELEGTLGEAEDKGKCRVYMTDALGSVPSQLVVDIESADGRRAAKLFASIAAQDYLLDFFALHVPREQLGTYQPVHARISAFGELVISDGIKSL